MPALANHQNNQGPAEAMPLQRLKYTETIHSSFCPGEQKEKKNKKNKEALAHLDAKGQQAHEKAWKGSGRYDYEVTPW